MVHHAKRNLILTLGLVGLSVGLHSPLLEARWAAIDEAPVHIIRNDQTLLITRTAGASLRTTLEVKVANEAGKKLMTAFRLPMREDTDELKVLRANVINGATVRKLAAGKIKTIHAERRASRPLLALKTTEFDFGPIEIGAVAKIEFEVTIPRSRVPGVFSAVFVWGQEYPELSAKTVIECPNPLVFDISKAARESFDFKEGRSADRSVHRWEILLKHPIYRRLIDEPSGMITTDTVPRVQISNRKSWSAVAEPLRALYEKELAAPLPAEFKKIALESGELNTSPVEKINAAIERLRAVLSKRQLWSVNDNGLGVHSLDEIAKQNSADTKDFAIATVAVLREMGLNASVALAWREPLTERLIIEEKPTAPATQLFNHFLVQWGDGAPRYFDPDLPFAFADAYLSNVGATWVLPIRKGVQDVEYLPANDPQLSSAKFQQKIDPRPDGAVSIQGSAVISGPLAGELKLLVHTVGIDRAGSYLRQIVGVGLDPSSNTTLQPTAKSLRSGRFEITYTSTSRSEGAKEIGPTTGRRLVLPTPGLLMSPAFATADRVSPLGLIRNLTIEAESQLPGLSVIDETQSSCLSLTRFASLVKETVINPEGTVVTDNVQFKTNRITTAEIRSTAFQTELASFMQCLGRSSLTIGPRSFAINTKLNIDPADQRLLSKSPRDLTLPEINRINQMPPSPITPTLQIKAWLGLREILRKAITDPTPNHEALLSYAKSILQLGERTDGSVLSGHVFEAAKVFAMVNQPLQRSAELHRLHYSLLAESGRLAEAAVALKNATLIEPNRLEDQVRSSQLYLKLGKTELAESTILAAMTMDGPSSWKAKLYQLAADLHRRLGRLKQADDMMEQAIGYDRDNPILKLKFARQLCEKRNWEKAIVQSRLALALDRSAESEDLLSTALLNSALESYYYGSPKRTNPTSDPKYLAAAEKLALDSLNYKKTGDAYRIVAHAAFEKALRGDYVSLIAAQSYLSKASVLQPNDPWVGQRLHYASQALHTGQSLSRIWNFRVPAASASAKPAKSKNPRQQAADREQSQTESKP